MNMMMQLRLFAVAATLTAGFHAAQAAEAGSAPPRHFVNQTGIEFLTRGDFDGDGRVDVVIVDRETGRARVGYQLTAGTFTWTGYKESKVKDVTAVSVGRLFEPGKDALALVAADANLFHLLAPGGPHAIHPPVPAPVPGLGPNSVVIVDIGGADNTPAPDLCVSTMYNTPTANLWTLFRNDAGKLVKLTDVSLSGTLGQAQNLALTAGGPEVVASIVSSDDGERFRVESFRRGTPQMLGSITGLDAGLSYVVGHFRGAPQADLLFFQAGAPALQVRPITEATAEKVSFGAGATVEFPRAIKTLTVVRQGERDGLVATFDTGERGGVFSFDGVKAPVLVQPLVPGAGDLLSGAVTTENGFVLLAAPSAGKIKYSTHFTVYQYKGATNTPIASGELPSLADTDDSTVPGIRERILSQLKERSAADMKAYTNVIPGTDVKYAMLPIPGGEFLMGSPENEPGRKPDEGPQHKVKIEPFWMGAFEVTWNEFELFMYPDEERKLKESHPTDPEVDKLSDAVTRPSKPYVEMSFGMGKDGYPAIAMTHHAANKYCHWLSAKTGHFYRLPTEAEWEYACRAGTTTAYFFGDDATKLPDYAWFERNSDFKYQKVGRKKPNPWGLYDIAGNVVEWCIDGYDATCYAKRAGAGAVVEPWVRTTQPYPHVVRGGSWDDMAEACRSAARRGSERAWKAQDPQLPKSVWWLSDAQWVGFRLVRPLKVPPAEVMVKYWTTGTEKD
jgi:formylglycine-generating enzyme required for sulfatase activity